MLVVFFECIHCVIKLSGDIYCSFSLQVFCEIAIFITEQTVCDTNVVPLKANKLNNTPVWRTSEKCDFRVISSTVIL